MEGANRTQVRNGHSTVSGTAAGLVSRPRLSAHLDRAAPLLLLHAPTGFGKSVLVRQWLGDGEGGAVATVRVRPGEGDRDTFWMSVVDALSDAGIPLPSHAESRSPQSLAARMISTAGRALTVWIDNFENVAAEGADEVLSDLAAHTDGLQVIVGMRSFRNFAPRALRLARAVVLSARDLMFSSEEIAILLDSAGIGARDELVAAIHDGIGGWPAMVHALIEAMARDPDAEVTALMEHVASQWLHELLPRMPSGDIIDFALSSSIPETITPDLAQVVSADRTGPGLLERLVETGLLFNVDANVEPEYRWPSVARKTLSEELAHRFPDQLQLLNGRLGKWYAEQREPARALAHASAARDWQLVVDIIDRDWRALMLNSRDQLNRAFLETPATWFFESPRITPSRAIRSLFLQLDDPTISAAVLPSSPAELSELGASAGGPAAIDSALACLLALRTSARWTEAAGLSDRIVAAAEAARATQPGAVADLYASVQFFAGETALIAGETLTAIGRFERAYRRASDGIFAYIEADAASKLALAHALQGNVPAAITWLTRNRHSAAAQPPATWLAPFMYASRHTAELLIATDRLHLAEAAAAEAALQENVLPNTLSTYELYSRSLFALSMGSAADALEAIDRANTALDPSGRPEHYASLIAMIKADAYLAIGQGNRARQLLTGPRREHPLLRTTRARLALLAGEPAEALRLATATEWQRRASRRHRIEMLLIKAIAAYRSGDDALAISSLARAAAGAEQTRMLRPFITVPREDLITLASELAAPHRTLIESSFDVPEIYPASIALIKLTPREQQVLSRIHAGQSIPQIASALQLTYSTIRTQQRSLYRKLGAATRVQALTNAQDAGLISAYRP